DDCHFLVDGSPSDAHRGLELCMAEGAIPVDLAPPEDGNETAVSAPPAAPCAAPLDSSPKSLHDASPEARNVTFAVGELFEVELIHRGMNPWMFQQVVDCKIVEQGNEIRVIFQVDYGISGAPAHKHKVATVELTFALGGWRFNEQLYQVTQVGLSSYDGS